MDSRPHASDPQCEASPRKVVPSSQVSSVKLLVMYCIIVRSCLVSANPVSWLCALVVNYSSESLYIPRSLCALTHLRELSKNWQQNVCQNEWSGLSMIEQVLVGGWGARGRGGGGREGSEEKSRFLRGKSQIWHVYFFGCLAAWFLTGCSFGWLVRWLANWMDGWMGGWVDSWMVGWLVGWLDDCRFIPFFIVSYLLVCFLVCTFLFLSRLCFHIFSFGCFFLSFFLFSCLYVCFSWFVWFCLF